MKPLRNKHTTRGLSLIEITLVIGLMLALASIITYSVSAMTDWQKGRDASEKLKAVYIAQKSYMADHPSKVASSFTSSELIPYLPNRPGAMPSANSLEDQSLELNFAVMPPQFFLGGAKYDPSDSPTDSLWDVGSL
ncbi:MAG: hypothetical protein CMO55_21685 [Verrucomicrobiales bacterium]|nr:hypothetical protein [Verrucomicrobiales bacterium]